MLDDIWRAGAMVATCLVIRDLSLFDSRDITFLKVLRFVYRDFGCDMPQLLTQPTFAFSSLPNHL